MSLRSDLIRLINDIDGDIERGDSGYYTREVILRKLNLMLNDNWNGVFIVINGFNNRVEGVYSSSESANKAADEANKAAGAQEHFILPEEVEE